MIIHLTMEQIVEELTNIASVNKLAEKMLDVYRKENPVPELIDEELEFLRKKDKVTAVKCVHYRLGIGLYQAKQICDYWENYTCKSWDEIEGNKKD